MALNFSKSSFSNALSSKKKKKSWSDMMHRPEFLSEPELEDDMNPSMLAELNEPEIIDTNKPLTVDEPTAVKPRNSYFDQYQEINNRPRPNTEAYKSLSANPPTEEQYSPSKKRRLGALLAGIGVGFSGGPGAAFQAASTVTGAPYKKAFKEYETKLGGLKDLANMEGEDVKRDVQGLDFLKADEESEYRAKRDTKTDEFKEKEMDLEQQRIDASGNIHYVNKTNGHLYIFNPKTGKMMDMGKTDSSIKEEFDMDIDKTKKSADIQFEKEKALIPERARENFANFEKEQEIIEKNRVAASERTLNNQIQRDAARAGLPNSQSTLNRLRTNRNAVDAIADSDPDKYDPFWDVNPLTGYKELKGDKNSPIYKELYRALYKEPELKVDLPGAAKEVEVIDENTGKVVGYIMSNDTAGIAALPSNYKVKK